MRAPLKIDIEEAKKLPAGEHATWMGNCLKYTQVSQRIKAEDFVVYETIYAPAADMSVFSRIHNSKGNLCLSAQHFGNVGIGMSYRYDDDGNLQEQINNDAKFENIKKDDVIKILEAEGWFNRKTGETKLGICQIETDGRFTEFVMESIDIWFTPRDNATNPYWKVVIPTAMPRDWMETTYIIDGVAGNVQKTEERRLIEF